MLATVSKHDLILYFTTFLTDDNFIALLSKTGMWSTKLITPLLLLQFTANLAAFLTVERMQSPIKNLDHLASQSSVKYSTVNSSTAMTFFKNMANAEDILYQ